MSQDNDVHKQDAAPTETQAAEAPEARADKAPADEAKAEATEGEKVAADEEVAIKFADLGLDDKLLKGIHDAGYDTPTPIQAKAIPEALKGRDVLGIAQTGTGKTAAFVIPMIHRLTKGRARARMPRTLILAPTRELAAQVSESFEKYGKYNKLSMALLIGGGSFKDQEIALTRGVDVLIATPGRLIDHFERGKLLLTGVEVMVVDEADRMLDMGFIPDIEKIFNMTPFTRQTLFFSATMPPEITRLTQQFLSAPARIEASRPAQTAETITQKIVRLPRGDDRLKRATLRQIIDEAEGLQNGIIFCNRKKNVDIVAKSLQKHGYDARPIHGDLAQSFRMETLQKFRDGDLKLLVASDVAARGLDIPEVSHVFNFAVPIHADDYVHRIGRTGRAGRKGTAVMMVTPSDDKALGAVLKTTNMTAIEEVDMKSFFDSYKDEGDERPRRGRSGGTTSSGGRGSSAGGSASDTRSERPARQEQGDRPERSDRGGRSRNGRGRRDEVAAMSHPDTVKGFGDHVPDFIKVA
jgi:superfamily II DNA/RNA helicase